MKLRQLLAGLTILSSNADPETEITAVCYDSRKVTSGCVFVCIRGLKSDGHDYAEQAVAKGARLVVTERELVVDCCSLRVENTRHALAVLSANFYGNPSTRFKLIGVTGTNGKTTTTYLLKSILEAGGAKVGLIGTNQNMIGERVLPAEHTTPESLELQQLFREMADEGAEYVVMEVSSHALAQDRVAGCGFEVGVFTNLTQDHLDYHGTMEAYLAAKARLFTMCAAGVLNADDPASAAIMEVSTSKNFTYSIGDDSADITAMNPVLKAEGVEFTVVAKGLIGRAELGIPGRFSIHNALAAITTAMVLGLPLPQILEALKSAKGVKGRVEVVPTGRDFTVLIDYAHTPDGLLKVLTAIRGYAKGRVVALFGCGGDRDRTKRPKMGKVVSELADFMVVTSDNPRTEEPGAIIQDILAGIEGTKTPYVVVENRKEAIRCALENAKPDDVILLAGKGHETYQILKTGTIHFDEREVVAEALAELNKG